MTTIQRKQPFTSQEFKDIYSKVPRATVEVIVLYNNKIILAKRTDESWQGQLHIPGGTVFYKEHLVDAVKRVAQEELSINVKIMEQIGYIEYPSEEVERGFGWSVGIAFVCEALGVINNETMIENHLSLHDSVPDDLIAEQRDILEKVIKKYL